MFSIYFLCTGNRCRSPLAAAVMAHLTEPIGVSVGSAGLLDHPGQRPPAETLAAAEHLGIDLSDHRSISLSRVNLRTADLVVGFERRHVSAAVVDGGAAVDRTFNLIELASLLRDRAIVATSPDATERARQRVRAAHHRRVETARFVPGEEVFDPIGLALPAHIEMAERVQALCITVAEELFGRDALGGRAETSLGPIV